MWEMVFLASRETRKTWAVFWPAAKHSKVLQQAEEKGTGQVVEKGGVDEIGPVTEMTM